MPEPAEPFFSVIIATYNYGHYLATAIQSVLGQGGESCEVIVVDDGSTDNTSDVAQGYVGRVRYLRQPNAGAAAARNTGADLSRGRYLVFLDADDCLLPGALSRFRESIDADAEAGMVFGHHFSVSQDGTRREARRQPTLKKPIESFQAFLTGEIRISPGAFAVRRDCFLSVRYPEGITNGEDIVFLAQVLASYPCRSMTHGLVEMRAHGGRMRNNLAALERTGSQVEEALFRNSRLSPEAMRYRRSFTARWHLSLARVLQRGSRFGAARTHYLLALKNHWKSCNVSVLLRLAVCTIRSLLPEAQRAAAIRAAAQPSHD